MDILPAQPGLFITLLLLCSGMLFYASLQGCILAFSGYRRAIYLCFAIICAALSLTIFLEAKTYGAVSVEQAAQYIRWRQGTFLLYTPVFFYFVVLYTEQRRYLPWLILTTGVSLALFAVNLAFTPYSIYFSTLEKLPTLVLSWGESLYRYSGKLSGWYVAVRMLHSSVLIWAIVRCGMMFRKGGKRSSLFMGVALALPLLAVIFGTLVDLGLIRFVYIGSFSFLGLVLFMSIALGLDVRERNQRIAHLAYHDYLTDLPNLARLRELLSAAVAECEASRTKGALLMVGLDNFKTINDVLGHHIGDKLLRQVGVILQKSAPENAVVARLGGDEFMLLMRNLGTDPKSAIERARKAADATIEMLSQPVAIDNNLPQVSASIGVALFPESDAQEADILQHADMALHYAKESGASSVQLYLPSMQAEINRRLDLERGLRQALDNNEFVLYFQPQVTISGRLAGAEVLLRWIRPNAGIVSPTIFVPIAEQTGLIRPIGEEVLRQACAHIKTCERLMPEYRGNLSVNVSAWEFMQRNYEDSVRCLLDESGIDPARVTLEITESAFIHDIEEAVSKIKSLRTLGLRFSIDDFGTGYASLSYLRRLPVQELKIDQAFVHNLGPDMRDTHLVETIIEIGKCMGMEVLAEGVETEAQHRMLVAMNCPAFQGNLLAAPMDEQSFLHWLQRHGEGKPKKVLV